MKSVLCLLTVFMGSTALGASPCVVVYVPNSVFIAAAMPILEEAIVDLEKPEETEIDDVKSISAQSLSTGGLERHLMLTALTVQGVTFRLKMKQDCETGRPILVDISH